VAASPAARCATPKGSARGLLHHPLGHYRQCGMNDQESATKQRARRCKLNRLNQLRARRCSA